MGGYPLPDTQFFNQPHKAMVTRLKGYPKAVFTECLIKELGRDPGTGMGRVRQGPLTHRQHQAPGYFLEEAREKM